jgi:uncharacterized tellurite resistance protein B-like protein
MRRIEKYVRLCFTPIFSSLHSSLQLMNANQNVKTLIKILIGTAWLDGKIQPEERQYLHRIATEKGIAKDLEIQPLLYEFRAVKPEECYEWVREYLGDRPSSETCQTLIESISALIYQDGTIATEEAKLLTRIQLLDSSSETSESVLDKVLAEIRKLYQHGISKL